MAPASTLTSPNFDQRRLPVTMLVLHYTGMRTAQDALNRLCDAAAKVSAHYVICEDGAVHNLVPEDKRAWHAGLAHWRGITDINSASIGIEIVNGGHDFGLPAYPDAQIRALIALSRDIIKRHAIKAHNIVGHSDIAPMRKQDPGEKFPWAQLAKAGIGLWPSAPKTAPAPFCPDAYYEALARIGYDVETQEARKAAHTAFLRHFAPTHLDAAPDAAALMLARQLVKMTATA